MASWGVNTQMVNSTYMACQNYIHIYNYCVKFHFYVYWLLIYFCNNKYYIAGLILLGLCGVLPISKLLENVNKTFINAPIGIIHIFHVCVPPFEKAYV